MSTQREQEAIIVAFAPNQEKKRRLGKLRVLQSVAFCTQRACSKLSHPHKRPWDNALLSGHINIPTAGSSICVCDTMCQHLPLRLGRRGGEKMLAV